MIQLVLVEMCAAFLIEGGILFLAVSYQLSAMSFLKRRLARGLVSINDLRYFCDTFCFTRNRFINMSWLLED